MANDLEEWISLLSCEPPLIIIIMIMVMMMMMMMIIIINIAPLPFIGVEL